MVYNYFLDVINCFGKYSWLFLVKNKKLERIVVSFKEIFEQSRKKQEKIHVDRGTEFKGKFKQFCQEFNINLFSTNNYNTKSFIVERNIQTIEHKLEKIIT